MRLSQKKKEEEEKSPKRLYLKNKLKTKSSQYMAQVVELLAGKPKALCSNSILLNKCTCHGSR
jgi:hypothetical protein